MSAHKLGGSQIEWKEFPKGNEGSSEVVVDGRKYSISWKNGDEGLWVEFSHGYFGFDIAAQREDSGLKSYQILSLGAEGAEYEEVRFDDEWAEAQAQAASGKKRSLKIKSQMPGKILKILVQEGQAIEKGTPLLVMEAMKMENEIKAQGHGTVEKISVKEGQAVETGMELVVLV